MLRTCHEKGCPSYSRFTRIRAIEHRLCTLTKHSFLCRSILDIKILSYAPSRHFHNCKLTFPCVGNPTGQEQDATFYCTAIKLALVKAFFESLGKYEDTVSFSRLQNLYFLDLFHSSRISLIVICSWYEAVPLSIFILQARNIPVSLVVVRNVAICRDFSLQQVFGIVPCHA